MLPRHKSKTTNARRSSIGIHSFRSTCAACLCSVSYAIFCCTMSIACWTSRFLFLKYCSKPINRSRKSWRQGVTWGDRAISALQNVEVSMLKDFVKFLQRIALHCFALSPPRVVFAKLCFALLKPKPIPSPTLPWHTAWTLQTQSTQLKRQNMGVRGVLVAPEAKVPRRRKTFNRTRF